MEDWKEKALHLMKLHDEFEDPDTNPIRKCEIAWELLRDKVEADHQFHKEKKMFNDIQIDYTLRYIQCLMENGATLGLIARDIMETLGEEKFKAHK